MTPGPVAAVACRGLAEPHGLERVHDLLGELWRRVPDVDPHDRTLFEVAVIEIAGNLVEHAAPRPVRCTLDLAVHDDRLEAIFHDTGEPAAVDLSGAHLPDDLAETGRGLAMARAAVDVLRHDRVDGGNRWYLSRVRSR